MENLFVSVLSCMCVAKIPKFGRKGEKFGGKGEHNGAGVRLPPPRPVIKEFHRGNIFFLLGRKYRGNIVPNLQSSDPSPTSSATDPYLHRALEEEEERGRGGIPKSSYIANAMAKNRCELGCPLNGLLSVRLTLVVFKTVTKNYFTTSPRKKAARGPFLFLLIFTLLLDLHWGRPLTVLEEKALSNFV